MFEALKRKLLGRSKSLHQTDASKVAEREQEHRAHVERDLSNLGGHRF